MLLYLSENHLQCLRWGLAALRLPEKLSWQVAAELRREPGPEESCRPSQSMQVLLKLF